MTFQKDDNAEANRMWASASFVGVLIIIGLPLWWKTTEVYRVSLPYDKINTFDDLPHAFKTELTIFADDDTTATEIAMAVKKFFETYEYLNLDIKWGITPDSLHHALNLKFDEQSALDTLVNHHDLLKEHYNLSKENSMLLVQSKGISEHVWMAGHRAILFKDAKAAPTVVNVLKEWVYQTSVLAGARSDVADLARSIRFPPSDGYHIVLTVIHPRPDALAVHFPATEVVEDYIGTFVDELSLLHNFTLKSQWLYMMNFDFKATEVKDRSPWGRHFAVQQSRLPLLLTAAEERAATNAAEEPTINLALYVVPCDTAPLVIYDNNDMPVSGVQAFMSPKWGGVVLSSPSPAECRGGAPAHAPSPRHVAGAFLAQLRELLGIHDAKPIPKAHLSPLRSVLPRRWEVDRLLRLRTLEHLTAAQSTLRSLARLLGEISNIVINDDVGASINLAVEKIHQSTELMAKGSLVEAYLASKVANRAAETAFTEPSLLALLYFPDDQKYAIYIPLFLPVMFPVILSLKTLVLWFRGTPLKKEKID